MTATPPREVPGAENIVIIGSFRGSFFAAP